MDSVVLLIDFGCQPEGIIFLLVHIMESVTPIGLTILLYSLSGDYCRLLLTLEHSLHTCVTLSV